jgi:hypothetical protein
MVKPFAQDHGAGAQQGVRRRIVLAQAGVFGVERCFLHAMSLAQKAARRYENAIWQREWAHQIYG